VNPPHTNAREKPKAIFLASTKKRLFIHFLDLVIVLLTELDSTSGRLGMAHISVQIYKKKIKATALFPKKS
jgi:hypothetical protein